MLGILDALNSFDLGYKTTRKYDLSNSTPDEFEFQDYYGSLKAASCGKHQKPLFNYDPQKTSSLYYKIAFAYYWEHAVEFDMISRHVPLSSNQIRYEMIQSLRPLNELLDYVLSAIENTKGTNWQRFIANRGYSKLYGKALCEAFLKNPATIDSLANSVLLSQNKCMCSAYTQEKGYISSIILPLSNNEDDTQKQTFQPSVKD